MREMIGKVWSPSQPDNLVLQSLPFTYLYIDAESTDGQEHSIQFYSDVTGGMSSIITFADVLHVNPWKEWLSADSKRETTWDTVKSASLVYHHASLSTPVSLSEEGEMALDSTIYYAFPNVCFTSSLGAYRSNFRRATELLTALEVHPHPVHNGTTTRSSPILKMRTSGP